MDGTAFLFECKVLGGASQLVQVFNSNRDDEYEEIIDRCEDFLRQVAKEYAENHYTYAELEENDVDLAKLKGWLERVRGRDSFDAVKFAAAVEAVARCEQSLDAYASRVYAEEGEEPSPH